MRENVPAVVQSEQLYRLLLSIYPASHRRAYGPSMTQLFRDLCRDAHAREGSWGLCKIWLRALPDLGKSACVEHFANLKGKLHMSNTPWFKNRRRLVVSAAFALVCVATATVTWLQPRYYASTARVALAKETAPPGTREGFPANSGFDPYFLQTEFEKLRSKDVLCRVIRDLRLEERWARKSNIPGRLTAQEAYEILRQRVTFQQYRSTSLIEIRVLDEDNREAAVIANKIVDVFRDIQTDKSVIEHMRGIDVLLLEQERQKALVQAAQSKADQLRQKLGDIALDADGGQRSPAGPELLRQLETQATEAKLAYSQTESLHGRLSQMPTSELRRVLPTVYPDNLLGELLARYNQVEVEFLTHKTDFGETHPNVVKAKAVMEKIDHQALERIGGIMAGLKFKTESLERDSKMRTAAWQEASRKEIGHAQQAAEYLVVKRDLEVQKQIQQTIAMRLAQEQLERNLSKPATVQLVDAAEPGLRPVRPNWPLNIVLGILLGLLAGGAMALAMFFKGMIFKTTPSGIV